MRLQLAIAGVLIAGVAHADGTMGVRGVYYKERATRVMQPMLDAAFEVGERGLVTAHGLVDAITSASASAGAANAKPFTETRYEAGLGYTHDLGGLRLGGDAKYSTESDYTSIYGGVRGEADLAQKNATVGLGFGVSADRVGTNSGGGLGQITIACTPGTTEKTECPLDTYSVFASGSQILSPVAVLGVSVDVAYLDGFQANPYRTAIAGDQLVGERHPTERLRQAYAASLRYYVRATETAIIAAYRYYRDDWEVHAHTPEIRFVQQVGRTADASFRYRYHRQDDAFFYRDRYATTDGIMDGNLCKAGCVSDDVKLSNTSTHLLEAKLGVAGEAFGLRGRWANARFEGVMSYVIQNNRFGNAIIAHLGVTVPLEY